MGHCAASIFHSSRKCLWRRSGGWHNIPKMCGEPVSRFHCINSILNVMPAKIVIILLRADLYRENVRTSSAWTLSLIKLSFHLVLFGRNKSLTVWKLYRSCEIFRGRREGWRGSHGSIQVWIMFLSPTTISLKNIKLI